MTRIILLLLLFSFQTILLKLIEKFSNLLPLFFIIKDFIKIEYFTQNIIVIKLNIFIFKSKWPNECLHVFFILLKIRLFIKLSHILCRDFVILLKILSIFLFF